MSINDKIHLKKNIFCLGVCRIAHQHPGQTRLEILNWVNKLPLRGNGDQMSGPQCGFNVTYTLNATYHGENTFDYLVFIEFHDEDEAFWFRIAMEGDEIFRP
jgi:hypothetical protein